MTRPAPGAPPRDWSARHRRTLVVLAMVGALTVVGIVALSSSVDYSGPPTFSCTGPPARCRIDDGSASTWWALFGLIDSDTTITSPTGLWIARVSLAPAAAGVAMVLVLTVITAFRELRTRADRRRRLQRMRRIRQRNASRG